jgi:Ca-activated chloride channel family protein
MFLGMNAAIREMAAFQSAGGTKRMLLLTDGETEGEERCHELAQKAKEQGIVIGAFGTGDRYNEVLLSELAEKTLGQFSHLAVPEQIETSFKAEVESAKASVISNVRFSVNLAKEVRLESISRIFPNTVRLDPEYDPEGRIASVQGGSLRKDDITAYGLQLRLPARSAGRVRIAQVYVSYSIPSLQIEDRVEKRDIIVEYSGNRDLCGVVDREVVAYFNQINAQTLVEKAVRETKAGNLAGATETLNQAKALTHKIGNISLTQSIEEVSQELRTQGTISSEGIKTVIAGSRHTVRVDEEPGISQAGGPTP